jgi:hypothetical protein
MNTFKKIGNWILYTLLGIATIACVGYMLVTFPNPFEILFEILFGYKVR